VFGHVTNSFAGGALNVREERMLIAIRAGQAAGTARCTTVLAIRRSFLAVTPDII
jgi:hypothetical protein